MTTGSPKAVEAGRVLALAGALATALGPALVFADRWDGSNAAVKFLALCLGAGLALLGTGLVLAGGGELPRPRGADLAVAGYVVWIAIASVASPDRLLAVSGYRPYWDGLVAAVAAASAYAAIRLACPTRAAASRALRTTLRVSSAAFLVMGAASLGGLAGAPVLKSVVFEEARLGALIHQPTFLAALIAVWLVPMAAWAVSEYGHRATRSAWLWLSGGTVAAMVVMLAATAGRAGLVGAAAAGIAFGVLSASSLRAAAVRAGVVLVLGAAIAVPVVGIRSGGFEAARVANSFRADRLVSRTGAWATAVKAIADAPVLGSGPGTFVYAHQRFQTVEEARNLKTKVLLDPHDWLLATAATSGIPGALAALAITLCGIGAAWRARGSAGAALAAACGVIGHGVAVLATPNAFVVFPSALLMLAFAVALGPDTRPERAARVLPGAAAIAAGVLVLALGAATAAWGVRIVSAEWAYGTARVSMDATSLDRAVRLAPEVAEYARYAANAKVVGARGALPGSVEFSQAEDALVALGEAHPRDPLALLSAGALVDLAESARSNQASDYAGRLAEAAVSVLASAVEASPQSADARLRYSEALLAAGDGKAAAEQFQAARRIGTARRERLLHVRDLLKEAGAI